MSFEVIGLEATMMQAIDMARNALRSNQCVSREAIPSTVPAARSRNMVSQSEM